MNIASESNFEAYDRFLLRQDWSPFLQSWTMGEAYSVLGEEPVRITVEDKGEIVAICQAIIVPAKRGRHLAVMYGPILNKCPMINNQCPINSQFPKSEFRVLVEKLKHIAREKKCAFIRMSPFWEHSNTAMLASLGFRSSPLHMLAEHIWYLDLREKTEDVILAGMRSTTRNLIRRAEREGVVVKASEDPARDLPVFFALYDETRRRHRFVPYTENFIRAQVERFAPLGECIIYIARWNGEPVAASVHMVFAGETSYHHGASTTKYPKCFASYLLQWTAIKDAMRRGDWVYNFWGVAPKQWSNNKHPFAGVTLFKTGFGGELLELMHCMDLPISSKYWFTWCIEMIRKWRRGF